MLEQLKTELKKRGFIVESCQNFLNVKFTPQAPKIGYALHGLEIHFNRKLKAMDKTDKGFRVAFQPE